MDRPVSMVAFVAAVRYGIYEEVDVYWQQNAGGPLIKWTRVAAIWRSKRRFHLRTNLADFVGLLREDATRFQVWEHNNEFWVRAI